MRLLLFLFILIFSTACQNQANKTESNTQYDAELVKRTGADEYGMRKYVIAFLLPGPNRNQSAEEAAKLQKAHMENIGRMAEMGKLVLAGPFINDSTYSGIYIFDVETVEEAKRLTETDPAIQAGRLDMAFHSWYGSAALKEVNRLHKKLSKNNP